MSQIVVGVPGPWSDAGELRRALARVHAARYLFAGLVILDTGTSVSCKLELYPHNPGMRTAFENTGQTDFTPADLAAVEKHASTAYLIGDDPGYEAARTLARFAGALLQADGIAVKVESAGVAHTRERWLRDSEPGDPRATYALFVTLVGEDDRFFSCGMHNFALSDAAVPHSLGPEAGARLLNLFNLYRLTESPTLKSGEIFSLEADSPRFRPTLEPYVHGYDDTPMLNPHGLWMLRPA